MNEIKLPVQEEHNLSPFIIGTIIISIIAVIGIAGVLIYLLVQRGRKQQEEELLSNNKNNIIKKLLFPQTTHNHPVTSSLDSPEIFSTILKYPPSGTIVTAPPLSLSLPPTSSLCKNKTSLRDTTFIDPISISIARQSMEERMGYYKSPNRKPIPYYEHYRHSAIFSSSTVNNNNNNTFMQENDDDEDIKVMKSWPDTSYKVW
ncbi:uncharacterized protein BX663DRAFT_502754 [Cokeromyces recurvatus]|uniref:uncharacterized protein n=1 Tax=Cokeromyces recurvatus TaxID=90255 RepID=UPI00221F924D|nr:uncharacterized protein BX663DRAFT_502754 [Cokeromyces recurvatus]KAI7904546.1 hypothetical protein BX663DRAFT_502754 [Cokeromyces recurvatus]